MARHGGRHGRRGREDPERGWFRGRIFRCKMCDEEFRVVRAGPVAGTGSARLGRQPELHGVAADAALDQRQQLGVVGNADAQIHALHSAVGGRHVEHDLRRARTLVDDLAQRAERGNDLVLAPPRAK